MKTTKSSSPSDLSVIFSAPVTLTGFGVTDFFCEENDATDVYGDVKWCESGWYGVNGGNLNKVFAIPGQFPSPISNGVLDVNGLNLANVNEMILFGSGILGALGNPPPEGDTASRNEFALAWLDFQATPVPEPTSLVLFGVGLIAVAAGLRRTSR